MKVISEFTLKNKTIGGDPAKQYIKILESENKEKAIIIKKLILIDAVKEFDYPFMFPAKKFKDKILYKGITTMRVSTLKYLYNKL